MSWTIEYNKKAKQDLYHLDHSQRTQVLKAIRKVSQNPLPKTEGGFGKPLGNKSNNNLTGCYKIKIRTLGIRVIYALVRKDRNMKIIVISARADDTVYKIAADRILDMSGKSILHEDEIPFEIIQNQSNKVTLAKTF